MSCWFQRSLFFLSFLPLWISVAFMDVISILESKTNLWTEIISLVLLALGTVFSLIVVITQMRRQRQRIMSHCNKPTIKSATKQKAVTAEYLLSYILPLFTFEFTQWKEVMLFLIFFVILTVLCLKHHYVYANIVLEFCGYTCYDCALENVDGSTFDTVIISKDELSGMLNCPICYVTLGGEYGLGVRTPNA